MGEEVGYTSGLEEKGEDSFVDIDDTSVTGSDQEGGVRGTVVEEKVCCVEDPNRDRSTPTISLTLTHVKFKRWAFETRVKR